MILLRDLPEETFTITYYDSYPNHGWVEAVDKKTNKCLGLKNCYSNKYGKAADQLLDEILSTD